MKRQQIRQTARSTINTFLGRKVEAPLKLEHSESPLWLRNAFLRTVDEAIRELGSNELGELGVQVPEDLITDCVRLCCSLCPLEDDSSVIEPDVLSKDRSKFEQTGDVKFVAKAHRRGKVGWNVGRRVEVAPHYRRPHMTLVWTGRGRAVPKIVPRQGTIVHRAKVEKVPSGFGQEEDTCGSS